MATDLETLVLRIEANTSQYKKQMEKLVGQQRSTTRKIIKTNKDAARSFRNTAQSISVMHGPLGGVASRVSSFGAMVGGVGFKLAALSVGMSAVGFAAFKMVKSFMAAEVAMQTTKGLLRATGFAAGKTGEQIEALSRDIGLVTLASTQEVRKAANILLTFRTVSGQTFDRALRLSQDMVASGFGSITSNVVQLGKALESPREGLTALKRIGVDFSQSQKDLIKRLSDTGQRLQAQKLVLDGVARQMEGAGVAAAKSLAGEFDTLAESSLVIFEHWGKLIVRGTGLAGVVNGIAGEIQKINNQTLQDQIKQHEAAIARINNNNQSMSNRFGTTVTSVFKFIDGDDKKIADRQRQIDRLKSKLQAMRIEETVAIAKSQEAQSKMRQGRIESVKAELTEKIRLKGLTEEQLMLEKFRGKAGVEASSLEGAQIEKLVAHYMRLVNAKKESASATKKANREALKALKEEMKAARKQAEFFGQTVTDALSDIIFEGRSAADVMRNLGRRIAEAALQNVLVGTGPLSGGKQGGGLLTSLFSSMFANGGAFNSGRVQAFASGGVVGGPTMFPMRGGKAGIMGEAGPEAIMPLKRGRDGKLGVSGGNTFILNFHGQTDAGSIVKSQSQIASMLTQAVSRGQRNL